MDKNTDVTQQDNAEPIPAGASFSTVKARLTQSGVTWAQFIFQLVIVTAGVYIAIVVQDKADNLARTGKAEEALKALSLEIAEDRVTLRSIIDGQEAGTATFAALASAVRGRPTSDSVLKRLLGPDMPRNLTFFSRRAAYSTLVASGGLQYIESAQLRLKMAQVYEHDYVRLDRNGEIADDLFQNVFRRALLNYWDYSEQRPISAEPAAAIAVSNAAYRMVDFSGYYRQLLIVQEANDHALQQAIDSYLADR